MIEYERERNHFIMEDVRKSLPSVQSSYRKIEIECTESKCMSCSQTFSDDNAPRNLHCGHVICTSCVKKYIGSRIICPECRESSIDISQIKVNYPLLRFVRNISLDKITINIPMLINADLHSSLIEDDALKCKSHRNTLTFLCSTCSTWVCPNCLIVDHPFLPRGMCHVIGLEEARNEIRQKHKKMTDLILESINLVKNAGQDTLILQFCLEHCSREKRSHIRLFKHNEILKEDLKTIHYPRLDALIQWMRVADTNAHVATTPKELLKCCMDLIECQRHSEEAILQAKDCSRLITENVLQHLRMDLKTFVEEKEPIFVISHNNERGPSWANVTVKEDRLLMYSLRRGEPPKGIHVPIEYVKKLLPADQTTVFLEVGTQEKVLGRVFIHLLNDSIQTRQAFLMCTGEKGVSYRNSRFYKYDDKEGTLHGGDYEKNDGTGGRPILQGLSKATKEYWTRNSLPGAVVIENNSTRLRFYLQELSKLVKSINGKVVQGLDILQSLSKFDPITSVEISECGLFIPMNPKIQENSEL